MAAVVGVDRRDAGQRGGQSRRADSDPRQAGPCPHLGDRPLERDASLDEEHDTRGDLLGFRELLRREEHGAAALGEAHDVGEERATRGCVHSRRRLVEEERVRTARERERHGEAPTLPAGQASRVAIGEGLQVETSECRLRGVRAREMGSDEVDDLADADRRREEDLLQHRADMSARRGSAWIPIEELCAAPVGTTEAEEDRHRRRLARTVRPEQCEDLAPAQLEVDAVERSYCAERLDDAVEARDAG